MNVNRDLVAAMRGIADGLATLDIDQLPPLGGLEVSLRHGSPPSAVAYVDSSRSNATAVDQLRALVQWQQAIDGGPLRVDLAGDSDLFAEFDGLLGNVPIRLSAVLDDTTGPQWAHARELADACDHEAAGLALVHDVLDEDASDAPPPAPIPLCPGSGRRPIPGPGGNGLMCQVCRRGSRPLGMRRYWRAQMVVPDHPR